MPSSKSKSKGKSAPSNGDSKPAGKKAEQTVVEAAKEEAPAATKETPLVPADSGTRDENDLKVIEEVLQTLGLKADEFNTQDKLNAMCLIFKDTAAENIKLKDSMANMITQMEKNEQTKSALQKLCEALKTQVTLKEEENNLRLQEETQKRIEVTKSFESTMTELSKLIETHSSHNNSLREENTIMSKKLEELLRDFEKRETHVQQLTKEFQLQTELYETRLSKIKIEKAEMNADFTKERLELHKTLAESRKDMDILMTREDNYKEQIELYSTQYEQLEKGVGDKQANFSQFRTEIDKLTKMLRKVESDTRDWKDKFEASNEQVRKMNTAGVERENELEATKKKLAAMEKLNRALQTERANLLTQTKELTKAGQDKPS